MSTVILGGIAFLCGVSFVEFVLATFFVGPILDYLSNRSDSQC